MEERPTSGKKQEEILNYIKNEILERGFPPAVREICQAVGLKSTSSVHSHLESLERNEIYSPRPDQATRDRNPRRILQHDPP